jgi:cystathionine beta-lyase
MNDMKKFKSLINENTKLVWVETPTNPMMKLVDIEAIAKITKANKVLFVDNTFATPYLQNPLDLGADIVMHSTKYLAGHSDVMAGFDYEGGRLRYANAFSTIWASNRTYG